MKLLLSIIVGTTIMLSGLPTAFGFSLLRGKPQSVNRWPYGFGVHYEYHNGGSSWNYGRGDRHHSVDRLKKHRQFRFSYPHKRASAEKLEGLIKRLTIHSTHQKELFPPVKSPRYRYIGR